MPPSHISLLKFVIFFLSVLPVPSQPQATLEQLPAPLPALLWALGVQLASPGAGTGGVGLALVPAGLQQLLAMIHTAPC